MERRDRKRFSSSASVNLFSCGRMLPAELIDISFEGALIRVENGLWVAAGDIVAVGIDDLPGLPAKVRWANGSKIGVEFVGRLHETIVEYACGAELSQAREAEAA